MKLTRMKGLAVVGVAAVAVGVPVAVAATTDSDSVKVVAPERLQPKTIAPEPQGAPGAKPQAAAPQADGPDAGIPAPVGPPPSPNGAPVDIGDPIDATAPPESDVALPLPGDGVTVSDAQYSAKPVDDDTATGISFATRYYGVYRLNGTSFQVTVLQPSTRARTIGLSLGAATETLPDGSTVYSGPGELTSYLHGGIIVSVSGGDDAGRQALITGLKYTA